MNVTLIGLVVVVAMRAVSFPGFQGFQGFEDPEELIGAGLANQSKWKLESGESNGSLVSLYSWAFAWKVELLDSAGLEKLL